MHFSLTDSLINDIISAMENQDVEYAVDAVEGQLVISDSDGHSPDDERYYSLPEWGPSDGFELRENFVNSLHSPVAHDQLLDVLHSGRGVFKNFRNVLKSYPEVDKRWHIYKHKFMSARINEWYNSLREIWGLEKLDQLLESDETLVHDDFTFKAYDSDVDKETILFNITAGSCEDDTLPQELNEALYKLWRTQFENNDATDQAGFLCFSLSDEFAGCITAASLLKDQEKIMVITSLFVPDQFRGLGIGTELISMCMSKLQKCGKSWVLIPNTIAPDILQPLLTRSGFRKINSGYILSLGE
ncbi:MAG: GNAT family N-acetyltransferase [Treponema sp.]|nr:GNAT family N-acetyltransferase [Treponema sp.]